MKLLEEYCNLLTLALGMNYKAWNRNGLGRFDFKIVEVQRNYAKDNKVFDNPALNTIGILFMETKTTIDSSIFKLSLRQAEKNDFYDKLNKAFVIGMESKDVVSRYLLL